MHAPQNSKNLTAEVKINALIMKNKNNRTFLSQRVFLTEKRLCLLILLCQLEVSANEKLKIIVLDIDIEEEKETIFYIGIPIVLPIDKTHR